MTKRYEQLIDGRGTTIKNKTVFRLACCDCNLVHDVAIAVPGLRKGKEIGLAARRNLRATAARRRKKA